MNPLVLVKIISTCSYIAIMVKLISDSDFPIPAINHMILGLLATISWVAILSLHHSDEREDINQD
jgi:hypothetical protein